MVTEVSESHEFSSLIPDYGVPDLSLGLLVDEWGNLVSSFGFKNSLNVRLLAGLTHSVNCFIKNVTLYLPHIIEENQDKIYQDYLNSGLFCAHFQNKNDEKYYRIILRPIDTELFSSYWIKKMLNNLIKQLINSDDVVQSSINVFNEFNTILFHELNEIKIIKNLLLENNSEEIFIFRESGVYSGNLNNPDMKTIYLFALNNLENCNGMKFYKNENIYEIKRNDIVGKSYFSIKINKEI